MKLSYSGNYHDFNRLVKQLDDQIKVGGISLPFITYVDGISPANKLNNVYHLLMQYSNNMPLSGYSRDHLMPILAGIKSYLDKFHKSPYQD